MPDYYSNRGTTTDRKNPTTYETFKSLLGYLKYSLKFCAPVIVQKYNRKNNIVTVKLAARERIMLKDPAGNDLLYRYGTIDVPCLQLSGGGFTVSFPLREGDTGWILTLDVDSSAFLRTKAEFTPSTNDGHEYSRAIFIPDSISTPSSVEDEPDALIVQSSDSDTRIVFKNGQVVINSNQVTINGDVAVNGTLTVSGDVVGAGISLHDHIHKDAENRDTTAPVE